MSCHSKHCSLQVLLMASQVNKGDHLQTHRVTKCNVCQQCVTLAFKILATLNNVITLLASSQILTQSKLPWSGLFTTCPWLSKPRMSLPTLLVLPDSISCLWRNNFCLARPRPLSRSPCVKTPSRVLLPASTLPTTATLLHGTKSESGVSY